jgi:hypothetical protein
MKRHRYAASIAVLSLLWAAAPARAQVFTGRVDLAIDDATGGRLPGVTVDLTGPVNQSQVTDAQGQAHFLNLAPGRYTLKAALTGFNAYTNDNVIVAAGSSTPLNVRLAVAGTTENVVVTAATPIIDPKRQTTTTNVTLEELQNIPTARDPWVVMQTVPTITVDRVNVGGSESGQQSVYIAKGAQVTDNTWSIDGVPITDMGSTGSSPTYFDFDMFQEMAITTGGADAQNSTPGVQLNLVLKKGTNLVHGDGRIYFENQSLQGTNISPATALQLGSITGKGNRTDRYDDTGFDIGGPVFKDRLWAWGTVGRTDVHNLTIADQLDRTLLENYAAKVDAQITPQLRGNFTFFDGNKIKNGRSVGPTRPVETAWNQTGPTRYYKGEGNFVAGTNLFATGRFAYITSGFQLAPAGGLDKSVYLDDSGVYHNSYLFYETNRPQYYASGDASYFVGRQEIKAGFSWRKTPVESLSEWPGTNILTIWNGYPDMQAQVTRNLPNNTTGRYTTAFLTDTIALDRVTINGGIRFDHQTSSLDQTVVAGVPGFADLPSVTAAGISNAYDFNTLTPRVGVTYAFDEGKRTIGRASYAMFASQLPGNAAAFVSPIQYSYALYNAVDRNGNNIADASELTDLVTTVGVGPLSNSNRVNMTAPITHELLVGVDHQLARDLGVSVTATYRRYNDLAWAIPAGVTSADYQQTGAVSGTFPVVGTVNVPVYATTKDTGGAFIAENRPGYHQRYLGLEASATKRMANRWMARVGFSTNDYREYFDDPSTAILDPTRSPNWNQGGLGATPGGNSNPYQSGPNVNGGSVAVQSTGSGNKGNVFITPVRYQFIANGLWQARWGIDVGANYVLRQGYALPYYRDRVPTPDVVQPSKPVLIVSTADEFRTAAVSSLDARLEKKFTFGRSTLAVDFDVFNVLNSGAELQRQLNARLPTFNNIQEIMNPRIARIGARFVF